MENPLENTYTEEKLNKLNIPYRGVRLSDVPNGTYIWAFGERWKKVKTGKKTSIVIKEENIDNNFCVAMEIEPNV